MVLGGGCQGFCDSSNKALVIKSMTFGGGGIKKCPKLCDVINGQPLKTSKHQGTIEMQIHSSLRPG